MPDASGDECRLALRDVASGAQWYSATRTEEIKMFQNEEITCSAHHATLALGLVFVAVYPCYFYIETLHWNESHNTKITRENLHKQLIRELAS
jgi:hypothetical protein